MRNWLSPHLIKREKKCTAEWYWIHTIPAAMLSASSSDGYHRGRGLRCAEPRYRRARCTLRWPQSWPNDRIRRKYKIAPEKKGLEKSPIKSWKKNGASVVGIKNRKCEAPLHRKPDHKHVAEERAASDPHDEAAVQKWANLVDLNNSLLSNILYTLSVKSMKCWINH